jgi:uncharacterized membrane protein
MINTEIIYFLIYCFIGWICEEIYCSVSAKKIVNRGFLHGPYLPIYGFGAMTVLFLLDPFINNILLLFVAGMIATSMIEYLGSFFLEKIFHIKLWDYSKNFLNINGRVCLLNSTLFGLLSLLMVYIIHPFVSKYISMIPEIVQYYIAFVIILGMSFDFALSAAKMVSFNKALEEIRDRSEEVKDKLISLSTSDKTELVLAIKERWNEELVTRKARLVRNNKRIFLAFPSMVSKNKFIDNQLHKIRLELSTWILRGKKQYEEIKKRHINNAKNK